MVVCDNHSSNFLAFYTLLITFDNNSSNLCDTIDIKKSYLLFDTVHLIKSIRKSSLNHKRFLFPTFGINQIFHSIIVDGDEVTWKLFHNLFERESSLDANLHKAPKIHKKVLPHNGRYGERF